MADRVELPNGRCSVDRATDGAPDGRRPETRLLAISPDGQWLVAGGEGMATRIWNLTTWPPIQPREIGGSTKALVVSQDSRWLALGGKDLVVHLLDLKTPNAGPIKLVPTAADGALEVLADNPAVLSVAISADSHWLAAGSNAGNTYLWDLNAPQAGTRHVLFHEQVPTTALAISADSRWLVTGSLGSSSAVRWDLSRVAAGGSPTVLSGHKEGIMSMATSTDSRWLVTGSKDHTARLWDLRSGRSDERRVLRHEDMVSAVAISAQGSRVITGSYDKTVRLWNPTAADPSASSVVLPHHEGINALAASADDRILVTGTSYDYKATLFLLQTEDLVRLAHEIAGRKLTGDERKESSL